MKFDEHEGTVADMAIHDGNLLSVGNDGHLAVWDLRKGALFAMSDNFEEDLTAVCVCKNGQKVLASSSEGVINMFTWGDFGDCNDRIVGIPNSIDTMVKFDEDTVITGSEDGILRAVSILPNKILQVLGDPMEDDEKFFIQRVALSGDRNFVASVSLDDIVKIVEVSDLKSRVKAEYVPGEEEENEMEGDKDESDDSVWESDSSSEEEEKKTIKSRTVKKAQKMLDSQKRKQFFSDM